MANIQGIINTNSSYSVTKSDAQLESTTLYVWIYEGTQGVNTGGTIDYPTYELRATSVSYNGTRATSFQIAPLVKDYVESTIANGTYQSGSVWVDYQLINTIGGVESTDASVSCLGLDGYVYTSDISDGLDKGIRLSNREILNLKGQDVSIPILRNSAIEYSFEKDGSVVDSGTITNSNESDEQIVYLTNSNCDKFTLTYGSQELVGNPSFDETAGWLIQSNDVIEDGVLKCEGQSGSRSYTAYNTTTGVEYRASFDILNYVSGSIGLFTGSSGINVTGMLSANGTYEVTFTQTQTGLNMISFYSSVGFEGQLDNISLRDSLTNEEIAITNIEECKYDPRKLTFINKCGALQDVWMFKNSKKTIEVKSDTWNRMSPLSGGSMERASVVKVNTRASEKMTLNSGFYPESSNVIFEELIQSENVWMWTLEDTPRAQAINIKDTSINLKDSITDKAINYTINIELAYNKYRSL